MTSFNFWQKWLLIVGIYLIVFGIYLTFFSQSSFMDYLFNNNINPTFWVDSEIPENTQRFQGWIYGVLGAVIAGWGTLISFWAYYPFKTRERWAWIGLAYGSGLWYIADTTISAIYGVTFNVVFNTILLFFLAAPLVFTKRFFKKEK